MVIYSNTMRKKTYEKERNISGQVIAAIEAGDYISVYKINEQFDEESILGGAFSFYILGVLAEKHKDTDQEIVDILREGLFKIKENK